jgi:hypothetical protein
MEKKRAKKREQQFWEDKFCKDKFWETSKFWGFKFKQLRVTVEGNRYQLRVTVEGNRYQLRVMVEGNRWNKKKNLVKISKKIQPNGRNLKPTVPGDPIRGSGLVG